MKQCKKEAMEVSVHLSAMQTESILVTIKIFFHIDILVRSNFKFDNWLNLLAVYCFLFPVICIVNTLNPTRLRLHRLGCEFDIFALIIGLELIFLFVN
jgi:hypothetical protein